MSPRESSRKISLLLDDLFVKIDEKEQKEN